MKKKILVVVIIGFIFASIIFLKYKKESEAVSNTETVYLLQIGAYKNNENVVKVTKTLPNYVILEEGSTTKIIIAITKDDNNIEKLSQNYETVYIKELQMENKEFLDYLTKYDNLLNYTNNSDTIEEINNKVLNKYNEIF